MDPTSVKEFHGIPVLVQLRFPLVGAVVPEKFRGKLPYAADPKQSHWMPMPNMEEGGSVATQLLAMAVLYPVAGNATSVLEVRWASEPMKGCRPVTLSTLLDARDIIAITRVMDVPEAESPLILRP